MELLSLIDKLENLATQSTKVPLTGKTMVGAEKLLELVDQMRLAVPRDLQEALPIRLQVEWNLLPADRCCVGFTD